MKTIFICDILTDEEISQCIGKEKPWITKNIVKPNLDRINKATGQENDPDYLGYLIEHVCSQFQSPKKQ